MSEASEKIMSILQRPFPAEDIEWRISRCGIKNDKPWATVLAYITARAVHERLDEAFGLGGWRNEFREFTVGLTSEIVDGDKRKTSTTLTHGVICRFWFRDPDTNEWCWKENGAAETDIEPFKGGLSGSEKRAFEELGGGRYLYKLTENLARTSLQKTDVITRYAKTREGKVFYWSPPKLPSWALPNGEALDQKKVSSAKDIHEEKESRNESAPSTTEPITEPMETPSSYPGVKLPPMTHKGYVNIKNVIERAQALGWSEEEFIVWYKKVVSKGDLSTILPAQAALLIHRIAKAEEGDSE